jgi:predicted aminopeptidase
MLWCVPGCTVGYVISVGLGELGVLMGSRPITDVLDSNAVDAQTELELRYVVLVRDYATQTLKLTPNQSFTTFYDSKGESVAYNLSACRKDRLEAYVWSFPIVGQLEYLGFFDRQQAEDYGHFLESQGWDILIYSPDGYSTIGTFVDPLFSQALQRDAIDLTDLVIHEMGHNTVSKNSDSVFNESVATFIGRTGTLTFLADRFGKDNEYLKIATQRWADTDLYNQFWEGLYQALQAFYSREDLTSDQKIAQREGIFTEFKQRFQTDFLPRFNDPDRYAGILTRDINNAIVMIQRRYNLGLDVFQAVYDAMGQDLPAAIEVFRASADTSDPQQYLRDWLAARP